MILGFKGVYWIPHVFRLKGGREKLCDLARAGKEVERKARRVQILISILNMELPRVSIRVTCSKGTYIRTLCDDIGRELGTGGCMEHLLRTRVDRFLVEDSLKLDEIEQLRDMDGHEEKIYTVEEALEAYPAVYTLPEGDKISNRNPCFRQQLDLLRDGAPEIWEDGDRFRFYNSEGRFKGVYQYQEEKHWWKPWKMFDLDPDTFKGAARP